jgi:hypothetical protein
VSSILKNNAYNNNNKREKTGEKERKEGKNKGR